MLRGWPSNIPSPSGFSDEKGGPCLGLGHNLLNFSFRGLHSFLGKPVYRFILDHGKKSPMIKREKINLTANTYYVVPYWSAKNTIYIEHVEKPFLERFRPAHFIIFGRTTTKTK